MSPCRLSCVNSVCHVYKPRMHAASHMCASVQTRDEQTWRRQCGGRTSSSAVLCRQHITKLQLMRAAQSFHILNLQNASIKAACVRVRVVAAVSRLQPATSDPCKCTYYETQLCTSCLPRRRCGIVCECARLWHTSHHEACSRQNSCDHSRDTTRRVYHGSPSKQCICYAYQHERWCHAVHPNRCTHCVHLTLLVQLPPHERRACHFACAAATWAVRTGCVRYAG